MEAVSCGGQQRLRPVLMTSFTTMSAMLPMVLYKGQGSEIWKPLGVTIIGGLFVSTFITLFLIPTLYAAFETRSEKKKAGKK